MAKKKPYTLKPSDYDETLAVVEQATEEGKVATAAPTFVDMVFPDGTISSVEQSKVELAVKQGARPEAPEERAQRIRKVRGEGHQIQAGMEMLADVGTFGGASALAGALSPEFAADMRSRREFNTEGVLAGGLVGAVTPGGAAGLIGKAGQRMGASTAAALGGGRVAKAAGTSARFATEGAAFEAGQGVAELGLSPDPLTGERMATVIGGRMLYGLAGGAAIGGVGGALAQGAGAIRAARAARAAAKAGGGMADDVARMDLDVAKAAHASEADAALRDGYSIARQYDDYLRGSWVEGGDKRFAEIMRKSRKAIHNALDSENQFVREKGGRALRALDMQHQALREYAEAAAQKAAKAKAPAPAVSAKEQARLDRIREIRENIRKRGGTAGIGEAVEQQGGLREQINALKREQGIKIGTEPMAAPGTVNMRAAAAPKVAEGSMPQTRNQLVDDLLETNEALRKRIEGVVKPEPGSRMAQLEARIAELSGPQAPKGGAQRLAEGAAFSGAAGALGVALPWPIAALGGAWAAGKVGAMFGAKVAKQSALTERAITGFLRGSEKAGSKYAPSLATKVMASASFAPPEMILQRPAARAASSKLVTDFRAREAELRAQVGVGPDGRQMMNPAARQALHERLAALWATAPMLADIVEATAARRLEFLAEKLPPRPDRPTIPTGPDRWQPSELDIRTFARYVDATEHPDNIRKRMANGTITPEDAETLMRVYPAEFRAIKDGLQARLPELRATLPYKQRLMLSLVFGTPVDASLEPDNLMRLQQTFSMEPGTEGGTQQPIPKMGNIKKTAPDGTPAQRMGG